MQYVYKKLRKISRAVALPQVSLSNIYYLGIILGCLFFVAAKSHAREIYRLSDFQSTKIKDSAKDMGLIKTSRGRGLASINPSAYKSSARMEKKFEFQPAREMLKNTTSNQDKFLKDPIVKTNSYQNQHFAGVETRKEYSSGLTINSAYYENQLPYMPAPDPVLRQGYVGYTFK